MNFKEKMSKQNNSVKVLLKKLKRHDTVVVAIAVVIALVLCGGLIYLTTPAVTATAKEEFEEAEKENNEKTIEKLDELGNYLTGIDKSIEESQKSINTFSEKNGTDSNLVSEKVTGLGNDMSTLHTTITSTQTNIEKLKETIEKGTEQSSKERADSLAQIDKELDLIKDQYASTQESTKSLIDEIQSKVKSGDESISQEMNDQYNDLLDKLAALNVKLTEDNSKTINNFKTEIYNLDSEIKELSEKMASDTSATNNKIDQIRENLGNGISAMNDKLGKDIFNMNESLGKDISSMNENLGNNLDTMNENLGNNINSMNESLGNNINTMNESLGNNINTMNENLGKDISSMNENLGKDISSMNESLGSNINSMNENLGNNISSLNSSMDDSFSNLNTSISNQYNSIVQGQNTNTQELKQLLSEYHQSVKDSFTSVANGKQLVASALATKNIQVASDATFEELSNAIMSIQTEVKVEELVGNVSYTYHHHTNGQDGIGDNGDMHGDQYGDDYLSPVQGGCFTRPYYHVSYSGPVYRYYELMTTTDDRQNEFQYWGCRYCASTKRAWDDYYGWDIPDTHLCGTETVDKWTFDLSGEDSANVVEVMYARGCEKVANQIVGASVSY
ncbi:hypothetical protein [Butyrivibrio sp. XPD2006]|uniref:hypothetical protein n=1 Tax=Butyrivibrio sp. XPD2006 TaxID=1280668 RepID=UPI0012DBF3F2|nr:hypothetical protein [Butyrivibrio sp. XPD2006]